MRWASEKSSLHNGDGTRDEITNVELAERINALPEGTHKVFDIEDTILIIKSDLSVICVDKYIGVVHQGALTAAQVSAITTLCLCGEDNMTHEEVAALYAIAKPAIAGWECRPIP